MDLLTQLNRAVEYIEQNITDDEALSKVARVTLYSTYHFQRIFNYIADMPLSEYIRRRKLSLAALNLQSTNDKVIDIAMKYGYDSADGFTRAFRAQHGVMPSEARNPGVNLQIYSPIIFQIQIKGVTVMNWRIEEREAFEVFGIERVFGKNETDKVPSFWDELLANGEYDRLLTAAGGKIETLPKVNKILAVCGYNETNEDKFPYMICAEVAPERNPDSYKRFCVPKTTWAVFRADELDEMGKAISELFDRAYLEWMPTSGYEKSKAPDLEIYGMCASGKFFEEAWIPIKKA